MFIFSIILVIRKSKVNMLHSYKNAKKWQPNSDASVEPVGHFSLLLCVQITFTLFKNFFDSIN